MSVLIVLSSVRSLMCLGRVLQRVGAAPEKALSPQVQCLVLCGGVKKFCRGDETGCKTVKSEPILDTPSSLSFHFLLPATTAGTELTHSFSWIY